MRATPKPAEANTIRYRLIKAPEFTTDRDPWGHERWLIAVYGPDCTCLMIPTSPMAFPIGKKPEIIEGRLCKLTVKGKSATSWSAQASVKVDMRGKFFVISNGNIRWD